MTGAEIAAIIGAAVWALERIFSWKHKRTRSRQVTKIVKTVETIAVKNGFTSDPEIPVKP